MDKKKKDRIPELMTPKQIAEVKAEIAEMKAMLDGGDETKRSDVGYFKHAATHLDVEEMRKNLVAKERQLKKYTPMRITGPEADRIYAKLKKVEAWILENKPREKFVAHPRPKDYEGKSQDFERSIEATVKWMQSGGSALENKYHYWMRRLDPDAPRKDFNKMMRERP